MSIIPSPIYANNLPELIDPQAYGRAVYHALAFYEQAVLLMQETENLAREACAGYVAHPFLKTEKRTTLLHCTRL